MSVPTAPRSRRILAVVAGVVAATATSAAMAGPATAKESAGVISIAPGVVAPTGSCSPVQSFRTSGDTRVGDTALSSITADYSVKPCDSKQEVTVAVLVTEAYVPGNVLRDEPNARLSDRFTIVGVTLGTSYRVTLTVRDAVTGATVGTASRLVSAPIPTGA